MRRKKVITNNREIYEKFSMLNFFPEILLKNVKPIQVEKIIRNVNRDSAILDMEMVGNYIIVKKKAPLNFNIYLQGWVGK